VTAIDSESPARGSLDKLIRKIAEDRGFDLGHYRRSYLERRLAARMRVLGLATYRQYADRLDRDPNEYRAFMQTLTINVTDFFRDEEMWDELRASVIPHLVEEKKRRHGRTIRIWSAGCATGEEPYSLGMTMLESLGADAAQFSISISGTDLDAEALAVASRGCYSEEKLAHVRPAWRERYFEPAADGSGWCVRQSVRRLVRFSSYSLFEKAPMKLVDIVMCRNVFIYLNRAEQSQVLDGFWGALAGGGYLVLGRSEKLSAGEVAKFESVNVKERIYRKPART
jgi:chemotaxis methyl-accepting protein methylase